MKTLPKGVNRVLLVHALNSRGNLCVLRITRGVRSCLSLFAHARGSVHRPQLLPPCRNASKRSHSRRLPWRGGPCDDAYATHLRRGGPDARGKRLKWVEVPI